jgi:hypothetical protein
MRLPAYLVERRSHFLIDVAHGHAYRADDSLAVATLLEVERMAPEEVRYNPLAGGLVTTLLKRERRAATPELRALSGPAGRRRVARAREEPDVLSEELHKLTAQIRSPDP